MRILGVAGFAWEPKGTVRSRAFPLLATLAKRGHTVKLVTVPYDNPALANTRCMRDGVEVIGLPLARVPVPWLTLPRLAMREIAAWTPDVVHVFKPKGYAGSIAKKLLYARALPLCLDVDDWEGWGGWNEVKRYPWILKEYIDRTERSLMRRADAVTAASLVLEARVREQRGISDAPHSVPNCLTRAQYARLGELARSRREVKATLHIPPERKAILYTGHFERGDDVMQMCRVVLPALQMGCTLLLVGDGVEMPSVRAFFVLHPEAEVLYLGRLPMEGYLEAVAAADLAIFPYPDTPIYRAKCSARILDYLGMGRAVITTALGQNPEYIKNEVTGVLVTPNDEAAFAHALLRWIADDEGREQMGAKAREDIADRFLWDEGAISACEAAYAAAIMAFKTIQRRLK
jgi:glycosyltransferase involved in cell wall biosynthesis